MRIGLLFRTSLVAAAALLILPVSRAAAQGAGGGGQGGQAARQQELIDRVTKDLTLDEKKAEKVSEILKGEVTKRTTLMQELRASGGDPQSMRAKIGELAQETEKELAAVLTKEQVDKYKEIRAAWQAEGRGQGRRPNPGR